MSFLRLALALCAAILLLACAATAAPARLYERQMQSPGTCSGFPVRNRTDEYYVLCTVGSDRKAKGTFVVGSTDLTLEVIPEAVARNMSKFIAYSTNGGWDGDYGSGKGTVVRITIRNATPTVERAEVSTNNVGASVTPAWFYDDAIDKFVVYNLAYPVSGIFSVDMFYA